MCCIKIIQASFKKRILKIWGFSKCNSNKSCYKFFFFKKKGKTYAIDLNFCQWALTLQFTIQLQKPFTENTKGQGHGLIEAYGNILIPSSRHSISQNIARTTRDQNLWLDCHQLRVQLKASRCISKFCTSSIYGYLLF